jgi:predicted aspartyl protease
VAPVHINARGPYLFVVDTGATLTCVDEQLANELELPHAQGTIGYGATVRGQGMMRLVTLRAVQVGSAQSRGLMGCTLDLQPLKAAGLDVRGLLGLNFLKSYRVTLDFHERTMRLDPPGEQTAS